MATLTAKMREQLKVWNQTAVVRDSYKARVDAAARKIVGKRARYEAVARAAGGSIPWGFIGALHYRESSNSFAGVLHNGEKIIGTGRKTRLVPAGRGPFATWEDAAVDALRLKKLHLWSDWSWEGMAFKAMEFNGMGYWQMGLPSPYLYSGTTVYARGKFYADHKYSPNIVDAQLGVIPIMQRVRELTEIRMITQASRKLRLGERLRRALEGTMGVAASVFTLDNMNLFTGWLGPFQGIGAWAVALAGGALILWLLATMYRKFAIEDYMQGRWRPSGTDHPPASHGFEEENEK